MEDVQENSKNYILQALFLLMDDCPYEKINVTDIVKKAGVGRATFYRYFKSKEDVLIYYFDSNKEKFIFNQRIYPHCKEDYVKIATDVLVRFEKNKKQLKAIHNAHLDYIYLDYMNKNFLDMFSNDYPHNNKYEAYFYAGMLYNVSIAWLENDCYEPAEAIAKLIVDSMQI